MPNPYSIDLRWRIVWAYLGGRLSFSQIAATFAISERTVRRYVTLFHSTGDVKPSSRQHGPKTLLGEFERMFLFRMILQYPGIYLYEMKEKIASVFGVEVCVSTICRTLKLMNCTRQAMHRVAIQRSDQMRAKFMAEISLYSPKMLMWLDESGCDRRNTIRKYGYSMRGIPLCDQRLFVRGVRYSAIPIISLSGVHDVYLAEGNVNGEKFEQFIEKCLLPHLKPFNGINSCSVVVMDNASIHHVDQVRHLIETVAGARLCYLPPYSPDLNPAEGVFSQVKSIMKMNNNLFEVTSAPRAILASIFGMVTVENCQGHVSHCGYT